MTELSEAILALRAKGKSYRDISTELGCSKGTISYYVSPGQKEKNQTRQRSRRHENSLIEKTERFQIQTPVKGAKIVSSTHPRRQYDKVYNFHEHASKENQTFTFRDVEAKFGPNPTCYLTGDPVDYDYPSDYNFDHVQPRSKGGLNTLDNLELATKKANNMKGDMLLEDFLGMCEKILKHHGRI